MRRSTRFAALTLLLAASAHAQDERAVSSPDGALVFRAFIAQPADGRLFRLAYDIQLHGKLLIDTSFLGLEIRDQEPVLGENIGLTTASISRHGPYNSLLAEYMQNGSIGRRINLEVRVWNDGVAFRYVIPRSTPLQEIRIDDEDTEFHLPRDAEVTPGPRLALPATLQPSPTVWITLQESVAAPYPRSYLVPAAPGTWITHLDAPPGISPPFEGTTPWNSPWRILTISPQASPLPPAWLRELR